MTYQELLQKYPKDQIRKAMIQMLRQHTLNQNRKKAEKIRQLKNMIGRL